MKERLETLITRLQQASTHHDLQSIVHSLREMYDAEHVVYHSVKRTGEQYAALTYEQPWIDRYVERSYARIDPVVQNAYQRFHPLDWRKLDWTANPTRTFRGEAMDAGVGNQGLSVPIRGPNGQFALFTATANAHERLWSNFVEENTNELILIAHLLNQKALEFDKGTDEQPRAHLSPREIDALSLLANGLSRAQIAETLSISEHTLRTYIESARFKLAAQNTTHAVVKAIMHGLVQV